MKYFQIHLELKLWLCLIIFVSCLRWTNSIKFKPSPCPGKFNYESTTNDDRWYGDITFPVNATFEGSLIRIELDRPSQLLVTTAGPITSKENQVYFITHDDVVLEKGSTYKLIFMVKFDKENEIPMLETIHFNGQRICPPDLVTLALGGGNDYITPRPDIKATAPTDVLSDIDKKPKNPTRTTTQATYTNNFGGGNTGNQGTNGYNSGNSNFGGSSSGNQGNSGYNPSTSNNFGGGSSSGNQGNTGYNPNTSNNFGGGINSGNQGNSGYNPSTSNFGGGSNSGNQGNTGYNPSTSNTFGGGSDSGNQNNYNPNTSNLGGGSNSGNSGSNGYNPSTSNNFGSNNNGFSNNQGNNGFSTSNSNNFGTGSTLGNNGFNTGNQDTFGSGSSDFGPNSNSNQQNGFNSGNSNTFGTNGNINQGNNGFSNSGNNGNSNQGSSGFGGGSQGNKNPNQGGDIFSNGGGTNNGFTGRPNIGNEATVSGQVACGTVSIANPLITLAQNSEYGQWPWHVALFMRDEVNPSKSSYICGGSLVSKNRVITAAHCVSLTGNRIVNPNSLTAYMGKYNINTDESTSQKRTISGFKVNPEYNKANFHNDMAILNLNEDVEYTNYVRPICLWEAADGIQDVVGQNGYVVGWGYNEHEQLNTELKQATMPIVSTEKCARSDPQFFSEYVSENAFCAGSLNGTGPCKGDSGGGLVVKRNNAWYLRGIVSVSAAPKKGSVCNNHQYIVFTDTAKYTDFIKRNI